jgi:hypothetical protein
MDEIHLFHSFHSSAFDHHVPGSVWSAGITKHIETLSLEEESVVNKYALQVPIVQWVEKGQ